MYYKDVFFKLKATIFTLQSNNMKKGNPFYNLILLLLLFLSSHGIAQKTIIKNGDSWEYYDIGYLDEEWMLHPDSYKWKKGKTPIGYGDETVITNINYGTSEDNKHLLKYFKKEFYITDTNFLGYEFRILRDDGAVVYVNGKELFRSNMQNATITNTSLAKKTVDGNIAGSVLKDITVFNGLPSNA